MIDVFSCKPYTQEIVITFLLNTLGIDKTDIKIKNVLRATL